MKVKNPATNLSVRRLLRCPFCNGRLQGAQDTLPDVLPLSFTCRTCDSRYFVSSRGALDLRLQHPKEVSIAHTVGTELDTANVDFSPLKIVKDSDATKWYNGTNWHLSPELVSHMPVCLQSGVALDLGCGENQHKELCEKLGYEWVGMDYYEADAPIWADAHALPFGDNSFDFILSLAVLEHLQNPLVAMREAYRVLKPGGKFIGTVAFAEPFHGNSYYHHTHLGTFASLASAGFGVTNIAPHSEWNVLKAQAQMALFPKMPKLIRDVMTAPLEFASKAWWWAADKAGKVKDPSLRVRQSAGSFTFIAYKDSK